MHAHMPTRARCAHAQGWLAGLFRFLCDVGVSRELAEQTLSKLRAAGVTEERLRSTVTSKELQGMGILLAPRSLPSDPTPSNRAEPLEANLQPSPPAFPLLQLHVPIEQMADATLEACVRRVYEARPARAPGRAQAVV